MPDHGREEVKVVPRLRRSLGTTNLVLYGIVYMMPMAAFTLFGFITAASGPPVVLAYLIATLGIGLTGLSYAAMSDAFPVAGSVYAYSFAALGPAAGFIGGWTILLDYILIPSLVVLYGGILMNQAFPMIAVEVWITGFLLLATSINILGVTWSAKVDFAIAAIQIGFASVFAVAAFSVLANAKAEGLTLIPLVPGDGGLPKVIAGAAVVVISFLGFDAISTLSEEVREGSSGRTVGRATMICIGVMATIFIVVSWLLADLGRGQAVNDVASAGFEIIGHRLPWLAWPMTLVAGLALGIGATIPPQAAVARVLYAMARERHLPLALTKLHPRFQTPHIAVLVVASLMAVAAFTALPHVDFLASLVSFSALAAFLFVNASVIAWFGVRKKSRRLFRHWIIPSAGFMVVAYILAGMPPIAIAVGIGWMVIGIVYYAGLTMVARRARFRAPTD